MQPHCAPTAAMAPALLQPQCYIFRCTITLFTNIFCIPLDTITYITTPYTQQRHHDAKSCATPPNFCTLLACDTCYRTPCTAHMCPTVLRATNSRANDGNNPSTQERAQPHRILY